MWLQNRGFFQRLTHAPYLHVGTLILRQEPAIRAIGRHVEAISMAITNQNMPFHRHIDSIWEIDDFVISNLLDKFTATVVNTYVVSFEITDVKTVVSHHNIRRLFHMFHTGKPVEYVSLMVQNQTGWINAVNNNKLEKQAYTVNTR